LTKEGIKNLKIDLEVSPSINKKQNKEYMLHFDKRKSQPNKHQKFILLSTTITKTPPKTATILM